MPPHLEHRPGGHLQLRCQTIELLKHYPGDVATRVAADSIVRAGWGAHKLAIVTNDPDHFDEAIDWARVFWGANSMTSRCIRKRDSEAVESAATTDERETIDDCPSRDLIVEHGAPTPVPEHGSHLRQLTMDLLSSFVEALETSPTRLHDKERQEVISG